MSAAVAALLYPDPGRPPRLAEDIARVMWNLVFVRGVAVFGSLATGRADRWSDIDVLVACEDAGKT